MSLSPTVELRARIGSDDRTWLVDRERPRLALGRAPGCDVRLEDERVSRFHARIESKGGVILLGDGSTNGTWVVRRGGRPTWLHAATLPLDGAGALHLGSPDAPPIEFAVEERVK